MFCERALELLAVAQHRHVDFPRVAKTHDERHVALQIDALAVDGVDDVAGHQTLFPLLPKVGIQFDDLRGVESLRARIEADDDEKPRQKIHKCARDKDDEFLPPGLPVQRALIVGVLVLTLHGAVAADGQKAQGILGIPLRLMQELRPHTDGKLVDTHTAGLGRQKMAKLVHGDEHAENQDCNKNINHGLSYQKVSSNAPARPRVRGGLLPEYPKAAADIP